MGVSIMYPDNMVKNVTTIESFISFDVNNYPYMFQIVNSFKFKGLFLLLTEI